MQVVLSCHTALCSRVPHMRQVGGSRRFR
jgi:hypothetical protein